MSTIEEQANAWVARRHARVLGEAEHAQRDAWLAADPRHQGAYARALAIHNAISLGSTPAATAPANEPYLATRRSWLIHGGIAACLAATAGAYAFTTLGRDKVLATAKGEFRKVPLQDSSVATINSASRIEVDFTPTLRKINLRQGEAWFEVAKDKAKPFIVQSGDANIRAVGTAFAVRRFANGTEVLVTEGTVEVWSKQGKAQRRQLGAGERAFLPADAGAIAVARQPAEVVRKLAWREGKLILKNQTLNEAVADFNRYSAKTIVILDDGLRAKRLFGQYQLDAPELFARDVSTVLGAPLRITADTIFIG